MALVLHDRVQETGLANTTVSFTLTGAVAGFQLFSVIGDGNTTYYSATDSSNNWEVGIGTYSSTGPTLTRTTILDSSNSGSAVTFSGSLNIFVTYPSEKSVNLDTSGNVSPLGTVASGTWEGTTVAVAHGGTGVTASSGANSVVLRDANANVAFNNFTAAAVAVTAAGGTTVLTVSSARTQILVGSTTQTFQLPDATTVALGQSFIFVNNSSGALTVTNNASTTVEVIPSGGITQLGAVSIATSAGSWGAYSFIPAAINWGTDSLNLSTTVISGGTWQGGTIQSGYGGTGLTTFTGANNALYSSSASTLTAGTLPVGAGGTGLTSVTANRVPYGDGTNPIQTSVNFTYNGTTLLVGDGAGLTGATNPVVASVGADNNYVQSYIYNSVNDTNASADFTAYPNNGADASGWVDMGITSQTFAQSLFTVTGPNESYLFGSAPSGSGTSGNLVYATDSTGTDNAHQWYVGGFDQLKSAWKMQLTSTGLELADALEVAYGGTGLASTPANGELDIGNGTGFTRTTLTEGTGISITNGTGSITIASTGVDSYPGAGIAVSTGSAWGTSKASPTGDIVGTTDTQTLTSKQLQAYNETVTTVGTVAGTTYNIDLSLSNIFDITLGNNVTFTFTNPPSSGISRNVTIILRQDATGSRLATFTNAKYTDGTAPVLSTGANQVDVLTFFTVNGGSFWFGTFAMANVS